MRRQSIFSAIIATIVKMVESLPEGKQEMTLEHMHGYITGLNDDIQWNTSSKDTKSKLSKIAKDVRKKMAEWPDFWIFAWTILYFQQLQDGDSGQ
jgi:hypothetical protein